jgi:hypothetical protein
MRRLARFRRSDVGQRSISNGLERAPLGQQDHHGNRSPGGFQAALTIRIDRNPPVLADNGTKGAKECAQVGHLEAVSVERRKSSINRCEWLRNPSSVANVSRWLAFCTVRSRLIFTPIRRVANRVFGLTRVSLTRSRSKREWMQLFPTLVVLPQRVISHHRHPENMKLVKALPALNILKS